MKPALLFLLLLLSGLVLAAGCISAPAGTAPAPVPVPVLSPAAGARPHYVIGVDAGFPPFTSRDAAGNFSGFDIDAARLVAEREGFDVSFVALPWETIIPSLESGTIDLIWSGFTITDERRAVLNFSVPYYTVNQSIAVRAGSPLTVRDIRSGRARIGVQAGSTQEAWARETLVRPGTMPAANLSLYPEIASLTDALERGAVDASLVQGPSQYRAIAGRPLVIIGALPAPDTYAVGLRKTDPALLARIDNGLVRLMNDPAWQALKVKHGLA